MGRLQCAWAVRATANEPGQSRVRARPFAQLPVRPIWLARSAPAEGGREGADGGVDCNSTNLELQSAKAVEEIRQPVARLGAFAEIWPASQPASQPRGGRRACMPR